MAKQWFNGSQILNAKFTDIMSHTCEFTVNSD